MSRSMLPYMFPGYASFLVLVRILVGCVVVRCLCGWRGAWQLLKRQGGGAAGDFLSPCWFGGRSQPRALAYFSATAPEKIMPNMRNIS